MHCASWPHLTKILSITPQEQQLLEDVFVFFDPNRFDHIDYKQGLWNGSRVVWMDKDHSVFPTGHMLLVAQRLAEHGYACTVDRKGLKPVLPGKVTPDVLAGLTLHPYQLDAVTAAVGRRRGVIESPPRSGKTVMQAAVAAVLDAPSLLLVDKTDLAEQHTERLRSWGLQVGRLYAGHDERDAKHVVASFQTLGNKVSLDTVTWLNSLQLVQVDECHHLGSAETYLDIVLRRIMAPYRFAYSGTALRTSLNTEKMFDYTDFQLTGVTGPLIKSISPTFLQDQGFLVKGRVIFVPISEPKMWEVSDWSSIYSRGIVDNTLRNDLIVRSVHSLVELGFKVLVNVVRLEHGKKLLKLCMDCEIPAILSHGGKKLTRMSSRGELSTTKGGVKDIRDLIVSGKVSCVIGTSIYDEGVDIPELSCIVQAAAGKSDVKTVQRSYRPLTKVEGKSEALVIDFTDSFNGALTTQSKHRMEAYRQAGLELPKSHYISSEDASLLKITDLLKVRPHGTPIVFRRPE